MKARAIDWLVSIILRWCLSRHGSDERAPADGRSAAQASVRVHPLRQNSELGNEALAYLKRKIKTKRNLVKKNFALLRELWRLPAVEIAMWGGNTAHQAFASFTSRHRRFPVIQRKRWGVALLAVPEQLDKYLAGKARKAVRRNRRCAIRLGYTFGRIDPLAEIEQIRAINESLDIRQGRPMDPSELNLAALHAYFSHSTETFGIRDAEGHLVAYLDLMMCGEVAIVSRLLGHGDALDNGIMDLLLSETVRELAGVRRIGGAVQWLMYDMWFGATPGLRFFKNRLGFAPYRVRWTWRPA
jgi:hypothetical protein